MFNLFPWIMELVSFLFDFRFVDDMCIVCCRLPHPCITTKYYYTTEKLLLYSSCCKQTTFGLILVFLVVEYEQKESVFVQFKSWILQSSKLDLPILFRIKISFFSHFCSNHFRILNQLKNDICIMMKRN